MGLHVSEKQLSNAKFGDPPREQKQWTYQLVSNCRCIDEKKLRSVKLTVQKLSVLLR